MLKSKRELPPLLRSAERIVESWRTDLIQSVHRERAVSTYIFTLAACIAIGSPAQCRVPSDLHRLEVRARHYLSGLRFALAGLTGDVPDSELAEDTVARVVTPEHVRQGLRIVDAMAAYAHVRDAYLTYGWGGYEVEGAERHLRFRDSDDWTGAKDRAQQIIRDEIESQWIAVLLRSGAPPASHPGEFPLDLRLGLVEARELLTAWIQLQVSSRGAFLESLMPVEATATLSKGIKGSLRIDDSQSDAIVELLTLAPEDHALSLFHCPLVRATTRSLLIVPPALGLGNPAVCIPRLAVRRGGGLRAYGEAMEAWLLKRLQENFETRDAIVQTRIPYTGDDDHGDIDLLVYEAPTNRVLIVMLKAFILPDSVEEVMHANRELEKGVRQVGRARRWLESLAFKEWERRLRVPLREVPPDVHYALLGNGFVGSDWLAIPNWIDATDVRYLLLPRFRGTSIFAGLEAYKTLLEGHQNAAPGQSEMNELHLGEVTVELPSWTIEG